MCHLYLSSLAQHPWRSSIALRVLVVSSFSFYLITHSDRDMAYLLNGVLLSQKLEI